MLSIFRQDLDKYIKNCGCVSDEVLEGFKTKYKTACILGKSVCKYDKLFSEIFKLFLPKIGYCSDVTEFDWEEWLCYLEPTTPDCYSSYEITCTTITNTTVNVHYNNYQTGLDSVLPVDFTVGSCSSVLSQVYTSIISDMDFYNNFEATLSSTKITLVSKKKFYEHGLYLSDSVGLASKQTKNCDVDTSSNFIESYKIKCTRDIFETGVFELQYIDPVIPGNIITFSFAIDFSETPDRTCNDFMFAFYKALIGDPAVTSVFDVQSLSDCSVCSDYILLTALVNDFSYNLTVLTTFLSVTPVITYT